jgi:hypothetical protein
MDGGRIVESEPPGDGNWGDDHCREYLDQAREMLTRAYAIDMPNQQAPTQRHTEGECECGEYHHREDFL